MTRLLITGASGLLGLNLALQASGLGYDVTGWVNDTHLSQAPFHVEQVNLLAKDQIKQRTQAISPELIIHCAALANLEAAEADPDLASQLNSDVPGIIAEIASKQNIQFIHISTDAVFDGQQSAYCEGDNPSPVSVYARTKLEGENAVRDVNPKALIARVNFYGCSLSGSRSLAEFFINALSAKQAIKGFKDVFFRPLYTWHLGDILFEMAERSLQGVYHVLSSELISKYAFGVEIARKFGFAPALITPISIESAGLKAQRSPNLDLTVTKIERDLGHPMPTQDECLTAFYQAFQSGLPGKIKACV